jgi:hypothetical protein
MILIVTIFVKHLSKQMISTGLSSLPIMRAPLAFKQSRSSAENQPHSFKTFQNPIPNSEAFSLQLYGDFCRHDPPVAEENNQRQILS